MANSLAVGVAFSDPALSGGTLDNTPVGATTASSGSFTTAKISTSLTHAGTAGFYGKTPVAQRTYASSVHATAALASSLAFGAAQAAIVVELMNTNIALGIWATA